MTLTLIMALYWKATLAGVVLWFVGNIFNTYKTIQQEIKEEDIDRQLEQRSGRFAK